MLHKELRYRKETQGIRAIINIQHINNNQSAAGREIFTACKSVRLLLANNAACFSVKFTGFPDTM